MRQLWLGLALGAVLGVGATLSVTGRWAPAPANPIPDTLVIRERALDSIYIRDTVRLTRTRWRTDSVLVNRTDTLLHVDTVRVLVEAERRACDAALGTCEEQKANLSAQRDSALAAYGREAVKPKASIKRDAAMGAAGVAAVLVVRLLRGG